MTVKDFRKALTVYVVFTGKTIDREDKRQFIIIESGQIRYAICRFTPTVLTTMITMLQDESATVNVIVHAGSVRTPVGQMSRCGRDVAETGGTKVIDDHICV